MDGITKTFYITIGLVIGASLSVTLNSVYALTSVERDTISDQLEYSKLYTGKYQPVYDKAINVFTYESLCSGYYTQEDMGTYYKYTGFGDLASKYTYNQDKPKLVEPLATTTDPIQEIPYEQVPPVVDPVVPTESILSN